MLLLFYLLFFLSRNTVRVPLCGLVICMALFSSGSAPGVLCGLSKIHKKDTPMGPILSTISTVNYNLA